MIRDIELHVAYYVERMMCKDRYKGVNPVELSDHYFSIAMRMDYDHAIRLNHGTFNGDDVRAFDEIITAYYNGRPSIRVV